MQSHLDQNKVVVFKGKYSAVPQLEQVKTRPVFTEEEPKPWNLLVKFCKDPYTRIIPLDIVLGYGHDLVRALLARRDLPSFRWAEGDHDGFFPNGVPEIIVGYIANVDQFTPWKLRLIEEEEESEDQYLESNHVRSDLEEHFKKLHKKNFNEQLRTIENRYWGPNKLGFDVRAELHAAVLEKHQEAEANYDFQLAKYRIKRANFEAEEKHWAQQNFIRQKAISAKRVDTIRIDKNIEDLMRLEAVALCHENKPNGAVFFRALQLANAFLQTQTVIDRNKDLLAAVCITRAAAENPMTLGYMWRDFAPRVNDKVAFSEWARKLRKELRETKAVQLPAISLSKSTMNFINTYNLRLTSREHIHIVDKERRHMHRLAKWIGDAQLYRVIPRGATADRRVKILPVFLHQLETNRDAVPDAHEFFEKTKQPIDSKTVAATIVQLVLCCRKTTRPVVTQEGMALVSGQSASAIMKCKSTLICLIEKVQARMRSD